MNHLRSLRRRLLLATVAAAGVALLAAWLILSGLFREHAREQFVERLAADLDQVMARLEVDAAGQPTLDAARLSDPRWTRPHSGLYWQVDSAGPQGEPGLLRSRSLWDQQLDAPRDRPANGELHVHAARDAKGAPLLLIERTLQAEGARAPWRVMVAAELGPLENAARRFDTVLGWSLLALLSLLVVGAWLQVAVGLAPLTRLRRALSDLREGRTQRLAGRFPDEVQPLVDDLNGVLDRHGEVLDRARAQAGNLAHALKTPLTVLTQAAGNAQASAAARAELPALVLDQVATARRHVDWHLARARAAAAQGVVGLCTPVRPVADGLVRVMRKVHADHALTIQVEVDEHHAFAGEAQDLQEMLGNLLDNACKAAGRTVMVSSAQPGRRLMVVVEDDGPGIPEDRRVDALRRGTRLDESGSGSGLGLAIVHELAALYGGELELARSRLGGLRAVLALPAAGARAEDPPPPSTAMPSISRPVD